MECRVSRGKCGAWVFYDPLSSNQLKQTFSSMTLCSLKSAMKFNLWFVAVWNTKRRS